MTPDLLCASNGRLDDPTKAALTTYPAFMKVYDLWLINYMGLFDENQWLFNVLNDMTYSHVKDWVPGDYTFWPIELRGLFTTESGFAFESMPEPNEWGETLHGEWQYFIDAGIIVGDKLPPIPLDKYRVSVAEAIAWLATWCHEVAMDSGLVTEDEWVYEGGVGGVPEWVEVILGNLKLNPFPEVDHRFTPLNLNDRGERTYGPNYETSDELFDRIHKTIRRWVNRRYTRYGVGSPFPMAPKFCEGMDLRTMDDWELARFYARNPEGRRYYHA